MRPVLYHTTSIESAFNILQQNCLLPSEEYWGISFSRNKREKYGYIQFIFDRQLLSYNYKIQPFMAEAERSTGTDSSEEVILKPVTNVRRYLIGVDIVDNRSQRIILKKLNNISHQPTSREMAILDSLCNLMTAIEYCNLPIGIRLQYVLTVLNDKITSLRGRQGRFS